MKSLSRVQLFATSWTVAYQASPSMGFSRQEYQSGLPFPSPNAGIFPTQGSNPGLLHCRQPLYPQNHLVIVNLSMLDEEIIYDFFSFIEYTVYNLYTGKWVCEFGLALLPLECVLSESMENLLFLPLMYFINTAICLRQNFVNYSFNLFLIWC